MPTHHSVRTEIGIEIGIEIEVQRVISHRIDFDTDPDFDLDISVDAIALGNTSPILTIDFFYPLFSRINHQKGA